MHTVKKRVFATDENGRRFLAAAAGDTITDEAAKRLGLIGGKAAPKPDPVGLTILPDQVTETTETAAPASELPDVNDRMKLADLKAIAVAEGVETDANTRAEFAAAILAHRAEAPAHKLGAKAQVGGDYGVIDLVYDETDEQWITVEGGHPFDGEVPEESITAE